MTYHQNPGPGDKTDKKEMNGNVAAYKFKAKWAADKNEKDCDDDKDAEGGAKKYDKNVALAGIDKINENIKKTSVDSLQTLHVICVGSQGKNNVKCNLRSFDGFKFEKDSSEYKKKLDTTKKTDTKSLEHICDILSLDRKGTKEEISNRVLKFLMEPDKTMCVEPSKDEKMEDDDGVKKPEEDVKDGPSEDGKRKRKVLAEHAGARISSSGRPRLSKAGKNK